MDEEQSFDNRDKTALKIMFREAIALIDNMMLETLKTYKDPVTMAELKNSRCIMDCILDAKYNLIHTRELIDESEGK